MDLRHKTCVVIIAVIACLTGLSQGYCWAAGRNPGFSGPPRIEQLKIDVVRVSWTNIVTKRECADNFVVKYWPRSAPNEYEVRDPSSIKSVLKRDEMRR